MLKFTRHEDGFTIVEVMVAAIILGIVAAGAMLAIGSTTNTQNKAKVIARQRAIAEGVQKKLTADPTPFRTRAYCLVAANRCTNPAPGCEVAPYSCTVTFASDAPFVRILGQEAESLIVNHTVTVRVRGFDDLSDGQLPNDRDGIVPDRFNIEVDVRTQQQGTQLSANSDTATYTSQGTLNMAKRAQTGSLTLRACTVSQIDERMATGLCDFGTQTLQMDTPANCPANALECNAFNAAKAASVNNTAVTITPVNINFTLTGPLNKPTPPTIGPYTSGPGIIRDIPPGQYRVNINPPNIGGAPSKIWASHSIPGNNRITIDAGRRKEAVQVFKPQVNQASPPRIYAFSYDKTHPWQWTIRPYAISQLTMKLIPVPSGRTTLTKGTNSGWISISPMAYPQPYPNPAAPPAAPSYPPSGASVQATNPHSQCMAAGLVAENSMCASLPRTLEPGLYAAYTVHHKQNFPRSTNPLTVPGYGGGAAPGGGSFVQYIYVPANSSSTSPATKLAGTYNEYCYGTQGNPYAVGVRPPREQWIDWYCGTYRPWCTLPTGQYVGPCGSNGPDNTPGSVGGEGGA